MDQELYRMQQEAAERVRSMQKRARLYVRDEPPSPPQEAPAPREVSPPKEAADKTAPPPPPSALVKEKKPEGGSLLGALTGDRERLLLLMLAVCSLTTTPTWTGAGAAVSRHVRGSGHNRNGWKGISLSAVFD